MKAVVAAICLGSLAVMMAQAPNTNLGYTDTPMLPGVPYHVHDPARPHPPVVAPASQPGGAPSDALVLFDGKDLSQWTASRQAWKVENGYVEVVPNAGDIRTKETFGDAQLHVEWAAPAQVRGTSQNRGNSGIFLMGRYEVQVLDSYQNTTYPDGQAGAIYGQFPPLVNATRPPGEWQEFDIVFRAPRFDAAGQLVAPARMTVLHNGILVQDNVELLGPTTHQRRAPYEAHPDRLPIQLQDHGDPVRFRNIWIRELR